MKQSSIALYSLRFFHLFSTGCDGSIQSQNGESLLRQRTHRRRDTTPQRLTSRCESRPARRSGGTPPVTRRSLGLRRPFPNTPDPRPRHSELRKAARQRTSSIRCATNKTSWMPNQADRVTRLVDALRHASAPAVRLTDWDNARRNGDRAVRARRFVRHDSEERAEAVEVIQVGRLESGPGRPRHAAKAELKLDDETLARGSVVYRRWCMQCHGPTGAREAAHAVENGPMPRDYRPGRVQVHHGVSAADHQAEGAWAPPASRRADLLRVVRNGIDGTIMPAFPTLTEGRSWETW